MPDFGEPIDVRPLFAGERAALLDLLRALDPDEWWSPTICGDWSVHDVVLHLLGGDINNLSGGRDGFSGSALAANPGDLSDWPTLVAFIDHRNASWVDGTQRISPRLLIELLEWTGAQLEDWWPTIDMTALGIPVSWAGPEPAPTWLHIARELTERWTHQQHIRLATNRPGGREPDVVGRVLDTFARALPFVLSDAAADEGIKAQLVVAGDGGGSWTVTHHEGGWRFTDQVHGAPDTIVRTDVETAWQAFTLGLTATERRQRMTWTGNAELADRIIDMVTIIG